MVGEVEEIHDGGMEVKEGNIKNDAYKTMCRNSAEENKNRHKSMKNKSRAHK